MQECIILEPKQKRIKKIILKFLFPFYPVKIFKSVYLIIFIAALFAIRVILSYLNISIIPFGFKLSVAWIPIYICGFFLGPVAGLIFGFAMDNFIFLLNGGIWFWMYAIQEPIVGLIAGFFSSLMVFSYSKRIKITFILQKIIFFAFICFTIFIVVYKFYIIDTKFSLGGIKNIYIFAIVAIVSLVIYTAVNEVMMWMLYKKSKTKKTYEYFNIYCFVSILVIIVTTLFSFILGPISFVEYTKYISGKEPSNFIKYGSMYYLVPRVLKESIKTPLYILALTGIICAIKNPIYNLLKLDLKRW